MSTREERLALFLMRAQSADRAIQRQPDVVPPDETLPLSATYDLVTAVPDTVRRAVRAAEGYKLFFVFEAYLRDLVVDVLSKAEGANWWDKVPSDVQEDVARLEQTEEAKRWMALGSRDKSALMTYPQTLRVIDHCWTLAFEEVLRDKALIASARALTHSRNTLCHMTEISEEEMERVRQTMRDWFRMAAP